MVIQYKIGSNGTWTPESYSGGSAGQDVTVSSLSNNAIVYARLIDDAGNYGSEASVTIADGTTPASATITLNGGTSAITVTTDDTVTAKVTHTDNQSGVNITSCKYIYSTTTSYTTTSSAWSSATAFSSNSQTLTLSATTEGTYYLHVLTVDNAGNKKVTKSAAVTVESAGSINKTTSYVGYYADFEGDGTVDGVIYADLAVGGSGKWQNNDYSYSAVSNLKNYYVSQTNYKGPFGTNAVLSPSSTGNDRFYVMALEDFTNSSYSTFYWYYNASGVTSVETSKAFGKGKTNTSTMISKWNSSEYGEQNDRDMWGAIQTKVSDGWFVPFAEEWAAFGSAFGVSSSNYYPSFGLSPYYWSSTVSNYGFPFVSRVNFNLASSICSNISSNGFYVRLSTTF